MPFRMKFLAEGLGTCGCLLPTVETVCNFSWLTSLPTLVKQQRYCRQGKAWNDFTLEFLTWSGKHRADGEEGRQQLAGICL